MSNTKFTPGPWKVDNENEGCRFIKGGKRGSGKQAQYKKIAFTTGLHDYGEDKANAKLIAAAPEMYEALKLLSDWVSKSSEPKPATEYDLALAAIKKATS